MDTAPTPRSPARTRDRARAQFSRRRLLASLGLGAAATAGAVALGAPAVAHHQNRPSRAPADRFGRMFPDLNSFLPNDQRRRDALSDMGRPGGLMDAGDDLTAGPVELITDPTLSVDNPDNPTHTAGTHFFGQFIDHDITFDLTTALGVAAVPENSPNERTPALDLDSVYGGGPTTDPELYEPDGVRLRIESGGLFEDLPRTADGTAVLGDPRNDENAMVAGLQAAFILAHNQVVRMLQDQGVTTNLFLQARQIVTWHYQWLVVHEFLPLLIGEAMVRDILAGGRRYYHPEPGPAFIPVEFQMGYRIGHSMVRPSYRLNLAGDNGEPFFGFIFDPAGEGQPDPVDLRGGARAPRRFVGWQTFFDFGDGEVKPNKRLDTTLSTPLFHLPLQTIPAGTPPVSLAERNLLRHLTWQVPAGQRIAQVMGFQPLLLMEIADYGVALENQTPLWYYILAEAERVNDGLTLGPVGGRLVGEVLIGLLELDPASYLATEPTWRPTLPGQTPGEFRMTDLLRFAGVDPASRGQ